MSFKALFIAHAPDADYKKHNSMIETGKYKLLTYVVKSQEEAIAVSKSAFEKDKIDAILLCPGFTHSNVSEIFQALEGKVSVSVARGDGPSSKISQAVLQKEWFSK